VGADPAPHVDALRRLSLEGRPGRAADWTRARIQMFHERVHGAITSGQASSRGVRSWSGARTREPRARQCLGELTVEFAQWLHRGFCGFLRVLGVPRVGSCRINSALKVRTQSQRSFIAVR